MDRYNPFEEMDRMFEQFRTRTWTPRGSVGGDLGVTSPGGGGTTLDLTKHGDEYVLVADLPGFEREEIDLTFADDTLTLTAETETRETTGDVEGEMTSESNEIATGDEIAIRGELARSRRVAERVTIPKEVREDEISASYRNGVLEVHLPLVEADDEDDAKKIDISE